MPGPASLIVAAGVADYFLQNAGYFVAVAIVLVGLVYGFRDITRFSPGRALALSRVSFVESINLITALRKRN